MARLKVYDLATASWVYAGGVDPDALATDVAMTSRYVAIAGQWTDVAAGSFTVTQSVGVTKTSAYASYRKINRSVRWQGTCVFTSTGTAANAISLSLPVAARTASVTGTRPIGTAILYNQSTGFFHRAYAVIATTTTMLFMPTSLSSGAYLGTADFTEALVSTDGLNWDVEYESAS